MRWLLHATLLTALLFAPGGCATSSSAGAGSTLGSRDFIEREEITKGQWPNSFELVRSLRPQWLRVRGRDTIQGDPGGVQVVLDNVRVGGPDALRTIPVGGVAYFQWLDGISASQRWGTGFGNGAIFVSTRPR
jgi:hypothetical protein